MSAELLIAYARSGGAPPATLESLRVHADGSARAIVTNAWPDGAPQDEAGLYETTLGDDAVAELRALAADTRLDINGAIDLFESRIGFMAARGIDVKNTRFSTAFGRGLDYYTGFEFELHHRGNGAEPLVAGGRYDGLMTQLGSQDPIPAVGFSIWVDALTRIGRKLGGEA